MTNTEIAKILKMLSDLMDIHDENSFKTKAYSSAAFKIEKEKIPLSERDLDQLAIPGIGAAILEKIKEILNTGKLVLLEEYLNKTPVGIVEMLSVKGVGPRKIGQLWRELEIESIGELSYACQENRLVTLKGFGEKTQLNILKSIEFIQAHNGYYLFSELNVRAEELLKELRKAFSPYQFEITGGLRRKSLVENTIAFVTDLPKDQIRTYFKGEKITEEPSKVFVLKEQFPIVEFNIVERGSFYEQLFLTTNTEEFNEWFLKKYRLPRNVEKEEHIFVHNRLHYAHPVLRETAAFFDRFVIPNDDKALELIQPGDIRGIIHAHTTYSDGVNTLEEMALAAIERGYEYLVISDHSQAATYAQGLHPDRIKRQHEEIESLNRKLSPFKIFKSIEADILNDGRLDYEPGILATFDLVIASVHSNLKMSEEKAMMRLITAIRNPYTTILGHPTGRLLLSRSGYPIDYKAIIDACAENKVAIEINAHPRRLDLDWKWIPYALEKGVILSVNPDAHSIADMDLVKYGVYAAQKGGLEKENNLSSKSLIEFEEYLQLIRSSKTASISELI